MRGGCSSLPRVSQKNTKTPTKSGKDEETLDQAWSDLKRPCLTTAVARTDLSRRSSATVGGIRSLRTFSRSEEDGTVTFGGGWQKYCDFLHSVGDGIVVDGTKGEK